MEPTPRCVRHVRQPALTPVHTQMPMDTPVQLATILTAQMTDSASQCQRNIRCPKVVVVPEAMHGHQVTFVRHVQRDLPVQPCMDLQSHVSKDSTQMLEPLSAHCVNLTICAQLHTRATEYNAMTVGMPCQAASIAIPWELTWHMTLPMIDQDLVLGVRFQPQLRMHATCAMMASSVHRTTWPSKSAMLVPPEDGSQKTMSNTATTNK